MTPNHDTPPQASQRLQPLAQGHGLFQAVSASRWQRALFPDPPRVLPYARAISIGFRTFHIAAIGILLGGHVFALPATSLFPWLILSIVSGVGLMGIELYSSCKWLYQGKGVLVLVKLLLIAAVAVFWTQRVWLLLAALIIGLVGSHMPGRFRYYSIIHRRVI